MSAPTGVIAGGWEYVWAAYAASAVILVGYSASVLARYRSESRRRRREEARTPEEAV